MKRYSIAALLFFAVIFLTTNNVLHAQSIITSIAGNGVTQYIGDGWPATNFSLGFPYGVCVDHDGNVYVADYIDSRIRKVDVNDTLFTIAGTGLPGHSGDNGPAINATFHNATCICIDTAGNLYISEEYTADVRKIDKATGQIHTVCGVGTNGFFGDGAAATDAQMAQPAGVCVDKAGNLYIADYGNLRIRKVDIASGNISTIAGDGINGFAGDGNAATTAHLSYPKSVCVDTSGNIYIADYGNNKIRRVDATTGLITTVAGTGMAGYTGDNGPAKNATLRQPNYVFMSKQGNLYISDFGNDVIRAVTPEGNIFTIVGIGVHDYTGDGGPALNATLKGPTAVYVDDMGYLYIADGENSAIRKVTPHALGVNGPIADHTFNVFPNPSKGKFTILAGGEYKNASLVVYNTIGQAIYTARLDATQNTVDISAQPNGVYYVSIRSESAMQTQKIIVAQ